MNEFNLIHHFFKNLTTRRSEVRFGIGDDCACLAIPNDSDLLVSTDTLVSDVHFLATWDPYDIAYKAVMVNISDCAAMAAEPFALLLALTLPQYNKEWLTRFSNGLEAALHQHQVELIGGDTTHGPLSLSITIHGLTPKGKAIKRSGAQSGDSIFVSGHLGLAAFAVTHLLDTHVQQSNHAAEIQKSLHHPTPRTDYRLILREYATAAIDISDGLLADLNHLCEASQVGACLTMESIPVHPLLLQLTPNGLKFATTGGDDYELCFTVPVSRERMFLEAVQASGLTCYKIGSIEPGTGLRGLNENQQSVTLKPKGYTHF